MQHLVKAKYAKHHVANFYQVSSKEFKITFLLFSVIYIHCSKK